VQARLHGSDRDLQDLGDLTIFEVLVVSEDEGLSEGVGTSVDTPADPFPTLFGLKLGQRTRGITGEKFHQRAGIGVCGVEFLVEADAGTPADFAQDIDGLVGCNGVKPGTQGAAVLVKSTLQVKL
jgi:hypothetical protein